MLVTLMAGAGLGWYTPSETRRYVQDVRYFAIEHMDVRREASQARTVYQIFCSLLVKVADGVYQPRPGHAVRTPKSPG